MPLTELEHLVQSGDWAAARQELDWVLHFGNLDPEQRSRAMEKGCRIMNRLQQHYETLQMAEAALALAGRLGERQRQLLIRFDLGVAHLWLGNTREAVDTFAAFLEQGALAPADLLGKAWFNLGIGHRQMNCLSEAVAAFRQAADHYRGQGVVVGEVKCLLEEAWCHLLAEEWYRAEAPMRESARLLSQWPDSFLQAYQHLVEAYYHRQQLSLAESEGLVRPLLNGDHFPELLAHACWVAGQNALDMGRWEEARRLAERSLDSSQQCPYPDVVNQAYLLLNQAREALGERPWVLA